MDADLAGFIALGALIFGLFAWLRRDIRALREEMSGKIDALREEVGELRERVARIEGLLEAMFMRRDLTPLPEPPPPGTSDKSEAA